MNVKSDGLVLLFTTAVIVSIRLHGLFRGVLRYPLRHGAGYFMGVEVSPGFYEGPGTRWLQRYRTLMLAEHAVEAVALVVILASGRWIYLAVWAVAGACLFLCAYLGTFLYARQTLGASAQATSTVAVALETRRLGDYISWRAEAVCWALAAASWCLLLFGENFEIGWLLPALLTYLAVGLLPLKFAWMRTGIPLPAERTEEHHRWLDAYRRYYLLIMNAVQWALIVALCSIALVKGWPLAGAIVWLRWTVVAAALGTWLVMTFVVLRQGARLETMGRNLRPLGSWPSPFDSARQSHSIGWLSAGLYLLGLIMLPLFLRL